jgi:hypothetical protein
MSEADEYRQYAEETMRWVGDCTDPKEKLVLISLARTWLQAAGRDDSSGGSIAGQQRTMGLCQERPSDVDRPHQPMRIPKWCATVGEDGQFRFAMAYNATACCFKSENVYGAW